MEKTDLIDSIVSLVDELIRRDRREAAHLYVVSGAHTTDAPPGENIVRIAESPSMKRTWITVGFVQTADSVSPARRPDRKRKHPGGYEISWNSSSRTTLDNR